MSKRICLFVFLLVVSVCVGARIYYVNENAIKPNKTEKYEMNELVPIEENIFYDITENMSGYKVKVNSAQLLSYHEFLERYNYEEDTEFPVVDEESFFYPEMVIDVNVTIQNSNTEYTNFSQGIDFIYYNLVGTDFVLPFCYDLFVIANPQMEGASSFALRPETEMEFHLPFYFSPSQKINPIPVKLVENAELFLEICYYPEKKVIKVEVE